MYRFCSEKTTLLYTRLSLTHPNIALIVFIVSPGNCGVRSFIDKRMFVPFFLREDQEAEIAGCFVTIGNLRYTSFIVFLSYRDQIEGTEQLQTRLRQLLRQVY